MNKFLDLINYSSPELTQKALLFMRICVGLFMITEGSLKFMGGLETLKWVGSAIQNFGIHFWPTAWGFLAASAEFFGGIGLLLGLSTRLATIFLICVMIVALTMHIKKGDSIAVFGFPLMMLIVFISFFIMGGGKYSLDYYFNPTSLLK